ncbi:MAG: YcgN family cysteine cluster protein [Gammaproteobacteria bacterium]
MKPFWETVSLQDMSREQWESLCDGCARCCLFKFEDEDSGEIYHTDVVCRLLDLDECRCTRYLERSTLVPDCVTLNADNLEGLHWMPSTCAYRLLHEGKSLPDWHPLITGDPGSVEKAGISVRGRVVPEQEVPDPLDRIVTWLDE